MFVDYDLHKQSVHMNNVEIPVIPKGAQNFLQLKWYCSLLWGTNEVLSVSTL